ncbi:MAG: DUF5009 domain-containing protein [Bacteroidales bacterium]|nr:DUF5009 domain-containing protein [Bacteroidales bacterium]
MNKRIASIDALRGIAIVMMIMASAIGWGAGLPAWMFHCQCPPPTYAFNFAVKGITWVDLVFPWFLFSMGVAIPFALGARLRRGESLGRISLGLVRRWLTLAAFGLVLGNAGLVADYHSWSACLLRFGIWCGLFLALWRVPARNSSTSLGMTINLAGVFIIIAMLFVERFVFGAALELHHIDIIIMVLSLVALLGGFAWLLTRGRLAWRLVILAVVFITKEVNWHTHALDVLAFPDWIDWLFRWSYVQYLLVVLIGTVIGDILMAASEAGPSAVCESPADSKTVIAAGLCFLMTPLSLWGFFTRHIWILLIAVFILGALAMWLTREDKSAWSIIMRIGFACLQFGIVFDPIDGGITKDHANISYMLSTAGLACLMTAFLLWCESRRPLSLNLTMIGQNPMVAYTVTGFVIMPLLYLVGFSAFDQLTVGNPLLGFLRGVIIVCLMVALTCLFTRRKIFWRS